MINILKQWYSIKKTINSTYQNSLSTQESDKIQVILNQFDDLINQNKNSEMMLEIIWSSLSFLSVMLYNKTKFYTMVEVFEKLTNQER